MGRPKSEPATCEYCERPARYGGRLCPTHYMREKRGQAMTAPVRTVYRSRADRLLALANRVADAELGEEFTRAKNALIAAANDRRASASCPECKRFGPHDRNCTKPLEVHPKSMDAAQLRLDVMLEVCNARAAAWLLTRGINPHLYAAGDGARRFSEAA